MPRQTKSKLSPTTCKCERCKNLDLSLNLRTFRDQLIANNSGDFYLILVHADIMKALKTALEAKPCKHSYMDTDDIVGLILRTDFSYRKMRAKNAPTASDQAHVVPRTKSKA